MIITTKTNKTIDQVLDETRNICKNNQSPRTLERIEWLMSLGLMEYKACRKSLLSTENSDDIIKANDIMNKQFEYAGFSKSQPYSVEGEKGLTQQSYVELQECVRGLVIYNEELVKKTFSEYSKSFPKWSIASILEGE